LWVIFALLDPDLATQINEDTCESRSETLPPRGASSSFNIEMVVLPKEKKKTWKYGRSF
jgi:hypothetical protein